MARMNANRMLFGLLSGAQLKGRSFIPTAKLRQMKDDFTRHTKLFRAGQYHQRDVEVHGQSIDARLLTWKKLYEDVHQRAQHRSIATRNSFLKYIIELGPGESFHPNLTWPRRLS